MAFNMAVSRSVFWGSTTESAYTYASWFGVNDSHQAEMTALFQKVADAVNAATGNGLSVFINVWLNNQSVVSLGKPCSAAEFETIQKAEDAAYTALRAWGSVGA